MIHKNKEQNHKKSISQLKNLLRFYEDKVTCGVVFKLNADEYPLELLKVLNLIKDKIQKWNNNSLFTYSGKLFGEKRIIVIGADNPKCATDLIIYIYLKDLLKVNELKVDIVSKETFEKNLKDEIGENIKNGYPFSVEIEKDIVNHIDKILEEIQEN